MALFEENLTCPPDVILLRDLLPQRYFEPLGKNATGNDRGDTLKFVEIFEEVFCQLTNDIRDFNLILDIDQTDEVYLDMLIRNLGFDLLVELSETKKRKLAKVIIQAYKQKGTCPGIENTIRQFTGVDVTCFPFTAGWILDVSELALDTFLNPAPDNPAGFYTFDVVVGQLLSAEQRRIILSLIELIKPAHSHFRDLVEEGTNPFLLDALVEMNRGSLFLNNTQNTDGGWDNDEDDATPANSSLLTDVGYHGVAQYFADLFVVLEAVETSFEDAATHLISNATYLFSAVKPKESDITLLARAELHGVAGALAKRDEASTALIEFTKAMAFLNSFNPPSVQLAATTQPERDSTTEQKRAQFLYLNLTTTHGLGEGLYRYVRYIRDFFELGNDPVAEAMALELFSRTSVLNLATDFGAGKILANGAIVYGLQLFNVGAVYESRIQAALDVLDSTWSLGDKLYLDVLAGAGLLADQAIVLDALMIRNQIDQAKLLIQGIGDKQRIDGSYDDPINAGTAKLRGAATVVDSVGRAIKRIQDEGL